MGESLCNMMAPNFQQFQWLCSDHVSDFEGRTAIF